MPRPWPPRPKPSATAEFRGNETKTVASANRIKSCRFIDWLLMAGIIGSVRMSIFQGNYRDIRIQHVFSSRYVGGGMPSSAKRHRHVACLQTCLRAGARKHATQHPAETLELRHVARGAVRRAQGTGSRSGLLYGRRMPGGRSAGGTP